MSSGHVLGLLDPRDCFRRPFDIRYGCSNDRRRGRVRNVRFRVPVNVASNKVPTLTVLVENAV